MAVHTSGPECDEPDEPIVTAELPNSQQFRLGQQIDVLDSVDKWAEAGWLCRRVVLVEKNPRLFSIVFCLL